VFTLLYYKLLIAWMAWLPVALLLGFFVHRVIARRRGDRPEIGTAA
jgi:hypothetical protein